MNPVNPIKAVLERGGPTLGSWFGLRCSIAAERFGALGFDWVIVDLQHGSASWDGLIVLLQALQLGGTYSLVRVTGHDEAEIGRALDIGAIGVVVPMVSTPDEAKRVADAMRYPPNGTRSMGQIRKSLGPDSLHHDPFCVVMIETVEGMANVDAIAATPGVDCILLGGVDLAISMGLPQELVFASPPPPAIMEALDRLAAACRRYGKIAGHGAMSAAEVDGMLERSIRFIPVSAAALFLAKAAKDELSACRKAVSNRASALSELGKV